jgi:hypothetical protein
LLAAHAMELAFLEYSKELGLRRRVKVADLI